MRPEDLFAEIEQSDPEFRGRWAFEEPKMALGLNVYHLRTSRGWTQEELAAKAGMRQPRIAEIERGDGNPKYETLIRLSLALGAPLSALVASRAAEDGDEAGARAEWGVAHDSAAAPHTSPAGAQR